MLLLFSSLVFAAAVITNILTHVPIHNDHYFSLYFSIYFFSITSVALGIIILVTLFSLALVAAAIAHTSLHNHKWSAGGVVGGAGCRRGRLRHTPELSVHAAAVKGWHLPSQPRRGHHSLPLR